MGSGEVTRVYKKLGSGAVGIIKENPYILCEEEYGISFEKADAIAKSLDTPQASPVRILSASKYVLSYNAASNGHTCLPQDKLIAAVASLIEVEESVVSDRIKEFLSAGELSYYKSAETVYVMTNRVFEAEKYIAERLIGLSEEVVRFTSGDVSAIL